MWFSEKRSDCNFFLICLVFLNKSFHFDIGNKFNERPWWMSSNQSFFSSRVLKSSNPLAAKTQSQSNRANRA